MSDNDLVSIVIGYSLEGLRLSTIATKLWSEYEQLNASTELNNSRELQNTTSKQVEEFLLKWVSFDNIFKIKGF